MKLLNPFNSERGFTLVEMLWASALTLIVVAATFGALRVGLVGGMAISDRIQATDEGTLSMRLMERYIRQAMILTDCRDYYLKFSIEKPSGGNDYDEIVIKLYGDKLYLIRNGTGKVIANNVRNEDLGEPIFNYYNVNNQKIEDETLRQSETTLIETKILIDENIQENPEPLEVESDITLRNFNI